MPFIAAEELPKMELFPGARSGIVAGEGLMLSFLEMAEGSEVPEHSHPHEQAGLVLSGELQFRIGSDEKILKTGEAFIIPPNVVHSGVVVKGPCTRPRYLHPTKGRLYRQVQQAYKHLYPD